MRTTLTLDEDVADKAKQLAAKLNKPFKTVINDALRIGLPQVEKPQKQRTYRTGGHAMGLQDGYDIDNVRELLSHSDGESSR